MRSLLTTSLVIALCASANAQTIQRSQAPVAHPRVRQHVIAHPDPGARPPARFAVPGWSDEQTQQWLDNATSCEGCG